MATPLVTAWLSELEALELDSRQRRGQVSPLSPRVRTLGCSFPAEECVEFSFTCWCEIWTRSQELLGGRPDPQRCQALHAPSL